MAKATNHQIALTAKTAPQMGANLAQQGMGPAKVTAWLALRSFGKAITNLVWQGYNGQLAITNNLAVQCPNCGKNHPYNTCTGLYVGAKQVTLTYGNNYQHTATLNLCQCGAVVAVAVNNQHGDTLYTQQL